jgi:hypothetical protein
MAAKYSSDGNRQTSSTTFIRHSGGERVQFTKDVLLQKIDSYRPGWRSTTVTIPYISDLTFEGPINFPGVKKEIEISHQGLVKGQNNEAEVLKIYQKFSLSNNLHWKIFSNVLVKDLKWMQLANIFGGNFPTDCHDILKIHLEIDIVVLDGSHIILTEVKSSLSDLNRINKPIEQLKKAEEFLWNLLKIIGVCSSEVQITKVIAAPGPFGDLVTTIAQHQNCTLLDINDPKKHETLFSIDLPKSGIVLEKMFAALTFLKCCSKFQFFEEGKLRLALQEGAKGKEVSDSLTQHKPLEKWRHPQVDKINITGELFVWLDPVQLKIMDSRHPRQIILGPASTGKTILIQLKIIEKLRANENVLVVLPTKKLVSNYKLFFSACIENVSYRNLFIVTPEEDWKSIQRRYKANIFMDEFCLMALEHKSFVKDVAELAKTLSYSQLFWITMDFKQGLESQREFPTSEGVAILESQFFETNYLMLFHRCTANVLANYRSFCGPLTDIGHQIQGEPTEVITTKPNSRATNSIKAWAQEVKKVFIQQLQKDWREEQIAIVVAADDIACVLLFLELKSLLGNVSIHFESETLSLEWPVVIVCLSNSPSLKLSYTAFSRAIFKTITVLKPETENETENVTNDYTHCQHLLSILRINQTNPYKFRPIFIDMIGFRQFAEMRTDSEIAQHLQIDLVSIIKKFNFWILALLENNDALSEVNNLLALLIYCVYSRWLNNYLLLKCE